MAVQVDFLLNLELMKDGYPAINGKFGDRRRYYDYFTAYHQSNGNTEAIGSNGSGVCK